MQLAAVVTSKSGVYAGRIGGETEEVVMTRFAPFAFDALRRQLLRDEREIHLTPKAFDLLAILIEAAPRVVPKREIYDRLWPKAVVSDATLVGLIKELRRALTDHDRKAPLIRTVHRVGYAFAAPLARRAQAAEAAWRWLVAAGRRVPLLDGENVIGRDPSSTLQLDDSTVSRRHARILLNESGASLEDLGSKNGTCIRGEPVAGQVSLRNGDRLAFGRVIVTYREGASGLSTATQMSRAGDTRTSAES
jgi:DNA-binding winged helix-turn-helix (wHTH) protein